MQRFRFVIGIYFSQVQVAIEVEVHQFLTMLDRIAPLIHAYHNAPDEELHTDSLHLQTSVIL